LLRLLSGNDTLPVNNLCNGVAAMAHDKKNKRVYFTPMLIDRLSYVDLRTMRIHTVTNNFSGMVTKASDQSNIFTRMVIGDEDYGYALTNDSKHLLRFSTRNHVIRDLGSLEDAPGNEVSVHESCNSFGGDIIADDDDHLYLITFRNNVFRIKLRNKVAKHLGTITGLPENFTTNGVSVDEQERKLILVSSVDASDVYTVNLNSMAAHRLHSNNAWYAADLGSSNILKERDGGHHHTPDMIVSNDNMISDKIQLFPNPVTSNEFQLQFIDMEPGKYMVDILDVRGQVVTSTQVSNNGGKTNIVSVKLPQLTSKGIYIVRVTDKSNISFFSGKIVLQ
jgi:Secretion system C-terminal sorting domain